MKILIDSLDHESPSSCVPDAKSSSWFCLEIRWDMAHGEGCAHSLGCGLKHLVSVLDQHHPGFGASISWRLKGDNPLVLRVFGWVT